MNELKKICSNYSKWKPLEDYILRIESYKNNDGVLVLENCKALIESVCKTILHDLGETLSNNENIQKLVSMTCNKLSCLKNAEDLARSFVTVANNLGTFRNSYSSVGHGQSVYKLEEDKNVISLASTHFMLSTIEQLSVYIITVYQDEFPQLERNKIIRYEDHQEFNKNFDEQFEPIAVGVYGPYSPSEVLFNIDHDAYRTELISNNE